MAARCRTARPCRLLAHNSPLTSYTVGFTKDVPALNRRPFQLSLPYYAAQALHTSPQRKTDGVFRALTASRISMPWSEAFERQKTGTYTSSMLQKAGKRDLSPKKMSDSYHKVILPLAQDKWLSDTYINATGHLRLGTIFMDLDALSGVIAYKHTGEGVTTVTAALDRITIQHPLTELCDLEYSGQVTYATGRSSMEITCKVARAPPAGQASKEEDVMLTCTFTMVSLDPETKKSVAIPSLKVETPEERAIFSLGESRSQHKKSLSRQSLLTTHPNDRESALIHSTWLRKRRYHDPADPLRLPSNVYPMSSTVLKTASIMQPQYRNRHNFQIFGGFLLKSTFELAFCCCASFSHARPNFVAADPCTFLNPVPVGSVLYLTATVSYTDPPLVDEADVDAAVVDQTPQEPPPLLEEGQEGRNQLTRVHVRVDSKVRDVEHGIAKPTGVFNYTFAVERNVKVMPDTYQEFMMYIDARRRVRKEDGAEDERMGEDQKMS